MAKELTEDKNVEELSEAKPLFTEVQDAILNVVRTASLEEQRELAKELAAWSVTIAKWVGHTMAIDSVNQIVEDVFAKAERITKEAKK